MVCSDENISSVHILDDDPHSIYQLTHGIFTSLKDLFLCRSLITNGINGIVIDVDYIFSVLQRLALVGGHGLQLGVLNCHAVCVGNAEDFFALNGGTGVHTVHHDFHILCHRNLPTW